MIIRVGLIALLATVACGKDKDGGGAVKPAPPPAPAKPPEVAPAPPAAPAKPATDTPAPPPAAPAASDGLAVPTEITDNRCVGYTPDGTVAVVVTHSSPKMEGTTVRLQAFAVAGKPPFEPVEVKFDDGGPESDPPEEPTVPEAKATEVWTKRAATARAWIAAAKLEPCASKIVRGREMDQDDHAYQARPKGGWPLTVGGTAVKVDDSRAKLTVAVGGGTPRKVAALTQDKGEGDNTEELIRALYWHDKSPLLVVIIVEELMGHASHTAHATTIR